MLAHYSNSEIFIQLDYKVANCFVIFTFVGKIIIIIFLMVEVEPNTSQLSFNNMLITKYYYFFIHT